MLVPSRSAAGSQPAERVSPGSTASQARDRATVALARSPGAALREGRTETGRLGSRLGRGTVVGIELRRLGGRQALLAQAEDLELAQPAIGLDAHPIAGPDRLVRARPGAVHRDLPALAGLLAQRSGLEDPGREKPSVDAHGIPAIVFHAPSFAPAASGRKPPPLHAASRGRQTDAVGAARQHPGVRIRRGGPLDRNWIVGSSRAAFAGFGDYGEIIDRWLAARGVASIVAEEDARLLGFSIVYPHRRLGSLRPSFAELVAIVVVPPERDRGLGRSLLDRSELLARAWGARELRLHTARENQGAQRFFLRAGFGPREARPTFYPRGQAAIEMARRLS